MRLRRAFERKSRGQVSICKFAAGNLLLLLARPRQQVAQLFAHCELADLDLLSLSLALYFLSSASIAP